MFFKLSGVYISLNLFLYLQLHFLRISFNCILLNNNSITRVKLKFSPQTPQFR